MSEHHATCLSTGAYVFVTGKAVADGNVFLWCWEVLQWNLCCRSVNVETVRLEHMGFSGDAFRFKFKRAKNDQGGDLDHTKHVYANPLQPVTCPVLAWAVYMMVRQLRHYYFLVFFWVFFGCFLDHFPRSFKLYDTSHTPRAAMYLVPMLIVC